MQEFMFYIKNDGVNLPLEKEAEFLKQCELYIEELKKQGKLISAQPLGDEVKVISFLNGTWNEENISESNERHAGYYHIKAKNMAEAIAMAKKNPEFFYRPSAKIEVRLVKTEETSTGYVYPTENN